MDFTPIRELIKAERRLEKCKAQQFMQNGGKPVLSEFAKRPAVKLDKKKGYVPGPPSTAGVMPPASAYYEPPTHNEAMFDNLNLYQGDLCAQDYGKPYIPDYSCNRYYKEAPPPEPKRTPPPPSGEEPFPVDDIEDDNSGIINFFPEEEEPLPAEEEIPYDEEGTGKLQVPLSTPIPPNLEAGVSSQRNLFYKYGLTFLVGLFVLVIIMIVRR